MNFEQLRFLATVGLVLACLTLNWANILTFNFTVICMAPEADDKLASTSLSNVTMKTNANAKSSSGSNEDVESPREKRQINEQLKAVFLPDSIPKYAITSAERSQAMSIVAVGALLANFPIVVCINWHGPRVPFALLGLLGACATAAIPYCLALGFYWFLAARFFQGVAFAGDMATFGHFLANWTEHKRYAFLTATLALYVQLAPFFTFPAAGVLCSSSLGWPGVYYAHAIATLLFFLLFGAFYRNRAFMPAVKIQPNQSELDLKSDEENASYLNAMDPKQKKKLEKLAKKHIPYREILTSKAVWAIFLSAVGDFTAVNLLYQFTPIYLYAVQGFQIMETGLMATLPPLVQAIMKELAGLLNDRIPRTLLSETAKTKLFNSIALFSTAGFLLALAAIPSGHGYLALGLITAAEALLGFIVGGFYKSGPQLAGLYGPFVMGQVSTALTLTMLVVPFAVSQITYENTFMEWALAFCLVAFIAIICNIYYIFFASAEPAHWATLEAFKERMGKQKLSMKQMNGGIKKVTMMNGCNK